MADYITKIRTQTGDKQIDYNALANLPTIPTALPNPNTLTFTGAVTATYDGSNPIEVNIPKDVTTDSTLSVTGQAADAKATGDAISSLSEEIADEVSNRENAIADLKAKGVQQTPLYAQGDTVSDALTWLGTNGDTSKVYVLPNGNIGAYVGEYTEGGTVANFTNQLPISTDTDGSIYNDIGYMNDMYLSNGVPSIRSNSVTTGFVPIPVDVGSTAVEGLCKLYFANTKLDRTTTTRICYYTEDKSFAGITNYGSAMVDSFDTTDEGTTPVVTLGEDGYISSMDISEILVNRHNNGLDVKFVRICGAGINSDSIITVNEEITYTTVEDGVEYSWQDTGRAFVPADYEDRIIALETENTQLKSDLESAEQRIEDLENAESTSTTETVPQAVIDGVSALVNKALSRADGNVIRFPIYSDAHQKNDDSLISKGNKELGQAIGEIVNQIGVDFVSGIGDYAWAAYANTTETVKEQIKQFNKFVNPYIKGEQDLNCEGNHDDAVYSTIDNDGDGATSSTEKLSLAETYSLIYAKNKNVVFDADHYIDGYCYKDFEHLKVRVICLNAEQGTGDGGFLEGYQLKWFAETALDMTNKNDWNVITLAHHPLDYPSNTLFKDCVNIVDAFINGSNFSYTTTNGTSISIDYSDKNCQYVGHFHGHAHAFSVVKMQKYVNSSYVDINAWEICIPNACYSRNNQYKGNTNERLVRYSTETTYNKSDVDGLRTSFNLVTVDLDNKIIYADNYGVGIDRQVSYSF